MKRTTKRVVVTALAVVVASYPAFIALGWSRALLSHGSSSRSSGSSASGRIVGAVSLPPWGEGFRTYSVLGAALGRQYVHHRVAALLKDGFAALSREHPPFVVGETGWRGGGPFRPHRTHENGLSVDVFVPLRDGDGRPDVVGTWPWTLFGYGLELDARGRAGELQLDFEALAALLVRLERTAPQHGAVLARVILTPDYHRALLARVPAQYRDAIAARLMKGEAWVRHDEHVHLDFRLLP